VLHVRNIIVCVSVATKPYVSNAWRVAVTTLSDRFTRVDMRFGYMEETNLPRALALARKQGVKFDTISASFFLSRRNFRRSETQALPIWQGSLFIGMTRVAAKATDLYHLPTNRVIELGQQILI
jgi:KUP system potassium uptake protein